MFGRKQQKIDYLTQRVVALGEQIDTHLQHSVLQSERMNELRGQMEQAQNAAYEAHTKLAQYALDDIRRFGT